MPFPNLCPHVYRKELNIILPYDLNIDPLIAAIIKEEMDALDCVRLNQSAYVQSVVARSTGRAVPGWYDLGYLNINCFEGEARFL